MTVLKQSHSFDDVLTRIGRVQVFNEVEGFFGAFVFEAVNYHVESGFGKEFD